MNDRMDDPLLKEAIRLAEKWQNRANELLTADEKAFQEQMRRLLQDPKNKVILTKMMDRGFRSGDPHRVADQIEHLFKNHGLPDFSMKEKMLVHLFLGVGRHFPGISVPKMIDKMREDSRRAIIPGEEDAFRAHLQKRKREGVRMNVNHLGESVLGEEEALNRLETYIKDLQNPEIEYISVKISTIYSQIHSLAFETTVQVLKERLTRLFQTAKSNVFVTRDGIKVPKLVNLDMEEYRDLEITTAAFTATLDQPDLADCSAGIVLQAYLPDSYATQQHLTRWAGRRVAQGGNPIRLRIVKGANMEMEQVEAALHHWPLAPYDNKRDVDANFKRMVDFALEPENIKVVHLGVASHNLFELAYAYTVARQNDALEHFSFEMLEGMADHVRRAIQETSQDMLLYAPVASKEEFLNAIAYLIRRLDENTAPENYLRHSFNLRVDSDAWRFLKDRFIESYHHRDRARKTPRRIQDRRRETFSPQRGTLLQNAFTNEPDTDWSLAANRAWAEGIREQWLKISQSRPAEIPLVVAGKDVFGDRDTISVSDPSRIEDKILVATCALANDDDIRMAVDTAASDPDGWRDKTLRERHEILSRAALEIRRSRGDLIGVMAANTGKVFPEADAEVSVAVDFVEYYPHAAKTFESLKSVQCRGKGVGLVISPWNFPVAIPCSGIVASLSTGNTVILKPATAAVPAAWHLCQCFWRAGVSKKTLQFLPCVGAKDGMKLSNHPGIDFIIFTGATDTGLKILAEAPAVPISAETGGKNATIVTAMSDRGQAISNVIESAFSHAGQKCSATSLLILEREVYEDAGFKRHLVNASRSMRVGSGWDFENRMGPLCREPDDRLKRALTRLEPGESWALEPRNIGENPRLWTPGIKWDVRPGSVTHMTEFFGPLLAVLCADDLDQAVALVNQTGYGLATGLESLDEREHERWKKAVKAGNLYINRGTTGARVLRQPFGGWGKSSLGAGIKVGGPNYVSQFMDFEEAAYPTVGALREDHTLLKLVQEWEQKLDWGDFDGTREDMAKTVKAVKSYLYHAEQEFTQEKDYFHLRGQDNLIRYVPVGLVVVRLHPDDTLFDVLARTAAVRISGCRLEISVPEQMHNPVTGFFDSREGKKLVSDAPVRREPEQALIHGIPRIDRIRYAAPDRVPVDVLRAAGENGHYISRDRVMMEGRIELLHYYREQSVCFNYHRYGNLGERALTQHYTAAST